jgi:uridylate kinase
MDIWWCQAIDGEIERGRDSGVRLSLFMGGGSPIRKSDRKEKCKML